MYVIFKNSTEIFEDAPDCCRTSYVIQKTRLNRTTSKKRCEAIKY